MRVLRRYLTITLASLILFLSVAPNNTADAAPVPSSAGISNETRDRDLTRIEELLNDPTVLETLEKAGTDAEELRSMLPRMSDHDIHQLAERMADVKVGGIGVIEILLIIILVLVIVYLVA